MRVFLLHSNELSLQHLLDRLLIPHGTQIPSGKEKEHLIIHWGAYLPDRGTAAVIQPVRSILFAANHKRASELLSLQGIECDFRFNETQTAKQEGRRSRQGAPMGKGKASGTGTLLQEKGVRESKAVGHWSHEFVVPVFHLSALSLFHKQHGAFIGSRVPDGAKLSGRGRGDFQEIGVEEPTYHAVRAMREAVKTVYSLGLDYGVIRIGVRPDGGIVVLDVEAVPKLTDRLAELFAEGINRYAEEFEGEANSLGRDKTIMLGADPEFLLCSREGKVRFASNYMEKDGPIGCDAIVLPSRRKIFPLAELRPKPSADVRELVINLQRTMQLAARRIGDNDLQWLAGGMPVRGFPLGGHVHLSGLRLDSRLLRVWDNYVALPLTLLEDATTGARKPQYGFLGDFRRKRHGGFEYRVLPSWLVSPTVTKGVLALIKLTAEHYEGLQQRPLAEQEVAKAYYRGDKTRIRPLLPPLWRDIERLPGYSRYEAYLLPLYRMMLQMRTWNERADIREKWKIGR